MNHLHPGSNAYDELLDGILAGTVADIEQLLDRHPELAPEERRRLRALARAVEKDEPVPLESGADSLPFETLGEFRMVRRLGEGNVGMVFLAEQSSLGRLVALKLLRPGLSLAAEARSRLAREAQALAKLRHPNVVTALSFGQEHGVHFIAMEYVEGRGLDEILAAARAGGERPTVIQLTGWCRDIANGLQAAHEAGIVHRDVKPSNIRIRPDGQAILLDFGLVRDSPDSTLTRTGAFCGSPRYSSPEQIDPRGHEIDARTDVYSLGITLYEAVTLRPPFEGPTAEAVFALILAGDAVPPRKVAPSIPRELETVILTAIEPNRGRRYQSAADLGRDLDALLGLRDILARPPSLSRRVRKWVRRRPAAAALLAAAIVALLTAAGVLLERAIAERRALRSRGEAFLGDAAGLLERARAAGASADAIERDVVRLREEMIGRVLTVEEGKVVGRGEGPARALRLEQETAYHAAVNRAHDARALLPESGEPAALLAGIYMERWRDTLARGDAGAQRTWEKLVSEHDHGGVHRSELAGTGTATFEIAPAGAEVHLFRYEEQADVVADGERRLVPVPVNGAATPVPPGTWCLRVVRPASGLDPEDLIFEMESRPIEGTLFMIPTKPGIQPLDVVRSVNGRTVANYADFMASIDHADPPASRKTLAIEGKDGRYEFETGSLAELASFVSTARTIASVSDFDAAIWRRGVIRRERVPKGLTYRCTAAPLFLSQGCSIGRAPIAAAPLAPGSYLAYVSHAGFEPQRVPFVVERSGHAHVATTLRPERTTPSEFRYVPPGPALVGRLHAVGSGSLRAATRFVPGFAICDHEVSIAEFLWFLNAKGVSENLKKAPELVVFNRPRGFSMWNYLKRDADGKFEISPVMRDFPASGVSFDQAQAYARWMTQESANTDRPKQFAVPTDVEWEKAARGADGRPYPYGRAFHALWQKFGRATLRMTPEKGLGFPVDESPYGVYDMMGGLYEWCDRSVDTNGPGAGRTLRGTAWSETDERASLLKEWEYAKEIARAESGFRIVIRDAGPESRPQSR